jgi:CheY-like chemotaxis protein
MGLGLSIARAYVNLMGGKLSVRSEPGKGSIFSFTLPVKNRGKKNSPENVYYETAGNHIGSGKTILIAEDDYSNFELLSAILTPLGFSIIHALDGKEAVDMFGKSPGINLVLMDLKMANMNGFEATAEILKIKPAIPVIAQTAYAHLHDQKMAIDCGCIDYLVKPLNKHHLLSLIQKHIR